MNPLDYAVVPLAAGMLALAMAFWTSGCCAARTCRTASWRWTRSTSTRWRCWCCWAFSPQHRCIFEAALVIALLGFVGTVALSRYVLRRDIIE